MVSSKPLGLFSNMFIMRRDKNAHGANNEQITHVRFPTLIAMGRSNRDDYYGKPGVLSMTFVVARIARAAGTCRRHHLLIRFGPCVRVCKLFLAPSVCASSTVYKFTSVLAAVVARCCPRHRLLIPHRCLHCSRHRACGRHRLLIRFGPCVRGCDVFQVARVRACDPN